MLRVEIDSAASPNVAKLAMATGETISLAAVASAFAEKYSDGQMTLRLSGGTLQIVRGSKSQFCAQQ
jgi:hypothetical protein